MSPRVPIPQHPLVLFGYMDLAVTLGDAFEAYEGGYIRGRCCIEKLYHDRLW